MTGMETLDIKVDLGNANLKTLTEFVENTKTGEYTKDCTELLSVTFGQTELPIGSENILPYIDDQQVLLFGLSY